MEDTVLFVRYQLNIYIKCKLIVILTGSVQRFCRNVELTGNFKHCKCKVRCVRKVYGNWKFVGLHYRRTSNKDGEGNCCHLKIGHKEVYKYQLIGNNMQRGSNTVAYRQ